MMAISPRRAPPLGSWPLGGGQYGAALLVGGELVEESPGPARLASRGGIDRQKSPEAGGEKNLGVAQRRILRVEELQNIELQ